MGKYKPNNNEYLSIRDGFGVGLLALGKESNKVLALTADLGESLKMNDFAKNFPDRFIQIGISEQNMAGVAAGLALSGFVPFMGSFAAFQPMRNLDQIRTSICMMNANVKIISSHAGFSYAADGIQIQSLEDIGIMRSLPNVTVLVPADAGQAAQMTHWAYEIDGPAYMRLGREKTQTLSSHHEFNKEAGNISISSIQEVRKGSDITIVTNGYMVAKALDASTELEKFGINVQVLNLHTVKPLDKKGIIQAVRDTGKLVVVEEHQLNGGIGEMISALLLESGVGCSFSRIGVDDKFGQTAKTSQELWEHYGLTTENIVKVVREVCDSHDKV